LTNHDWESERARFCIDISLYMYRIIEINIGEKHMLIQHIP